MFSKIRKMISFYKENKEVLKEFKQNIVSLMNKNEIIETIMFSTVHDKNDKGLGRCITKTEALHHYQNELKSDIENTNPDYHAAGYQFFPYFTTITSCTEFSILDTIDNSLKYCNTLSDDKKKQLVKRFEDEVHKRMNEFYNSFEDTFFEDIINAEN